MVKIAKKGFLKIFWKIFFSSNVLECYNSARKLKKFEEKNFTLTNCSELDTARDENHAVTVTYKCYTDLTRIMPVFWVKIKDL